MNIILEALNYFGLTEAYTEEELKKVRNRKAKKCHPDIGGKDEEMQLVNYYYEILKSNLKNKKRKTNVQLNAEKRDYILKFQECCNNFSLSWKEFQNYKNNFEISINNAKNSAELKQIYRKWIRIVYENNIKKINAVINQKVIITDHEYQLEYKDFYEVLYKKLTILFRKRFDDIGFIYQSYYNYSILEKLILEEIENKLDEYEKVKEKCSHDYSKKCYEIEKIINSGEEILEKLNKNIEKMFKTYFYYIKALNELLNNVDDEDLENSIKEFIISFNNHVDFDEANKFIIKTIAKYKKKKSFIKIYNNEHSSNKQKSILEELKEDIFNKCDAIKEDDHIVLYFKNKLVGVYFPETDTMNVLLKTSSDVVWNHYGVSWFGFSALEEGKFSARIIGPCGRFCIFKHKGYNGYMERVYTKSLDYARFNKNYYYLGYCKKIKLDDIKSHQYYIDMYQLNINILNYSIQINNKNILEFFNNDICIEDMKIEKTEKMNEEFDIDIDEEIEKIKSRKK